MAKRGTVENVQSDMQPPNYRAAVQKIRSIPAQKAKIAGVNGTIADIYAKIEGHRVHKKAAKMFAVLDALTPEERQDIMRSFDGLCDASGWDDEAEDLMDKATGKVVPMRMAKGDANDQDGQDEEGDDIDLGGEDDAGNVDGESADAGQAPDTDDILDRMEANEAAETAGTIEERPDDAAPGEQVEGSGLPPASDGFTEASEEELAAQVDRGKTSRRRLKIVSPEPEKEPYTGDNSDLANAAGNA